MSPYFMPKLKPITSRSGITEQIVPAKRIGREIPKFGNIAAIEIGTIGWVIMEHMRNPIASPDTPPVAINLLCDPREIQDKNVGERRLMMPPETTRSPAVTGFHVGFEQQPIFVCLDLPQLSRPFRRLPILDLRIMQAAGYEQFWIGFLFGIIVGGIRQHIVVVFLFVGVAPLIVF